MTETRYRVHFKAEYVDSVTGKATWVNSSTEHGNPKFVADRLASLAQKKWPVSSIEVIEVTRTLTPEEFLCVYNMEQPRETAS